MTSRNAFACTRQRCWASQVPVTRVSPHSAAARRALARPAATFQELAVPEDVQPLFEPLTVGRFELAHRIVYAPLTRCRSFGSIPQPAAIEYYSQRASAGGLMISEGTCFSPEAHGYPCMAGIDTQEHVEAWRPIVDAVHAKGGIMFLQLWHAGRASHPDYQPNGTAPISSSPTPIPPSWPCWTPKGGPFEYPIPRPLGTDEIPAIVQQFVRGARNAMAAGFDGVEVHLSSGYLIDQFIKDGVNQRTDKYGGPIENRIRFALEAVSAVADAVGADRVGARISPFDTFMGVSDSTPYATHMLLIESLNPLGLAYIHLVEPRVTGSNDNERWTDSLTPFRAACKSPIIVAGGHNRTTGPAAIRSGYADAVAYGRWHLANPDLPRRFVLDAPLNPYDRSTFFTQGPEGYADYPTLEQLEKS